MVILPSLIFIWKGGITLREVFTKGLEEDFQNYATRENAYVPVYTGKMKRFISNRFPAPKVKYFLNIIDLIQKSTIAVMIAMVLFTIFSISYNEMSITKIYAIAIILLAIISGILSIIAEIVLNMSKDTILEIKSDIDYIESLMKKHKIYDLKDRTTISVYFFYFISDIPYVHKEVFSVLLAEQLYGENNNMDNSSIMATDKEIEFTKECRIAFEYYDKLQ